MVSGFQARSYEAKDMITESRLLVAGRHTSCDPSSHSFLREIPQCWLTGQAAGAAAALAATRGCAPRAVPIAELQAILLRQGAWLRPSSAGQVEAAK
jgi:hypothetical protein